MSKDDVLGAIGLAKRPTTTRWLSGTLAILGAGIVVGAAAALLLAPKRGRELRSTISARLSKTPARTNEAPHPTVPA
jgi:gas vesicle protein